MMNNRAPKRKRSSATYKKGRRAPYYRPNAITEITSLFDIKTHLYNNSVTPAFLTPLAIGLSDPTVLIRGTGQLNNYIGNRITPVNLTVRLTVINADAYNVTRIIIVQHTSIANTAFNNVVYTNDPLSPIKTNPDSTFTVLSDNIINTDALNDVAKSMKIYIPGRKMLPLTFNQAGTFINSGYLQMVLIGDSLVPPGVNVKINSALKFRDS